MSMFERSPANELSGDVLNSGVYAAVAVVSAFSIGIHLLQFGYSEAAFVLAVLVVLLIVVRLWFVGPVVFLVQLFLLMSERQIFGGGRFMESDSVTLAAATLAFVIAASRYVALTSSVVPYSTVSLRGTVRENVTAFVKSLTLNGPGGRTSVRAELDRHARLGPRSPRTIRREEFATGLFRILVPLLVAMVLLMFVPTRPDSARVVGLVPGALRTATVAWIIAGCCGAVLLLLKLLSRNSQSPREAGVYLRTVVTWWCHRDLGAMVKRQIKHRKKSVVANAGRRKGRKPRAVNPQGIAAASDLQSTQKTG